MFGKNKWFRRAFCLFTSVVFAFFAGCKTPPVVEPDSPVIASPSEPPGPIQPLIDMVSIPGGDFEMGGPRGTPSSHATYPVHRVRLGDFSLGKYEVTQGEYFEVMGTRPSNFVTNQDDASPDGWKKLPVERINWYEALVFCNRLSAKEKLQPVYRIKGGVNPDSWGNVPHVNNNDWNAVEMIAGANGYRLPTEAEWEYAARGGSSPDNYNYAGNNNPDLVSWYYDNSGNRIREIGKKAANSLGLHDMSGNVMEWCWDWLGDYSAVSQDDPKGPQTSRFQERVIRGGSYSFDVAYCRVTYRHKNHPFHTAIGVGFRVARWE